MSEAALRAAAEAVPFDFPKDSPTGRIWHKLNTIRHQLLDLQAKKTHSSEELKLFHTELQEIENGEGDGRIFGGGILGREGVAEVPEGQAICSEMLAECYALVHTLEETAAPLSEPMREVVAKLTGLKNALQDQLGDLQLGGAVTPDKAAAGLAVLKRHQGQLDKIDAERLKHGGVFGGDVAAGAVPCGQALAASLLAEAYALVEEIQAIVVKE